MEKNDPLFIQFNEDVSAIEIPEEFTFPFYYTPHILSTLACDQLKAEITARNDWEHNFGIDPNKKGLVIGKMFGVLVVQNKTGELGFLKGFSGKLNGENKTNDFVPLIYDRF